MPQNYLHDIPFDTFVKYYLNNENDVDTISVNARYQPVYKVDKTSTVYLFKYLDNKNIEHCITTLKPMPFDIGDIGKKIYNTDTILTMTGPRITNTAMEIYKGIDRSKEKIRIGKNTVQENNNGTIDPFKKIHDLVTPIFAQDARLCIDREKTYTIYYIPIQDVVSSFFDNLSVYEYYGKIKDQILYSLFLKEDGSNGNKKQFYVMINEYHKTVEGTGYKKIENVIPGIKVITDQLYQDPEYDNTLYYSVINTKTNKEVGKIYKLEEHNVLDYDQYGRAHFVDTYKKEGMTNYDLYFNEDDMPITPIMKYHLYMRNYKSSANSIDIDPALDITKYKQTNTLYYKDFVDHGEIGYAYNFTETTYGPIIFAENIKTDPVYIEKIDIIKNPIEPKPTLIKTEVTCVKDLSSISLESSFEKALFTSMITTNNIRPTLTAKTTTVTANGAKNITPVRTRSTRALGASTVQTGTKGSIKIDLANPATSSASRLTAVLNDQLSAAQFRAVSKISSSSIKTIKEFGNNLTIGLIKDPFWIEKPETEKKIISEIAKATSSGKLTYVFFNTDDIYTLNILSAATIQLNKAYAVTAEAKAITERDHSLQRIIMTAISDNYDDVPPERTYNIFDDLVLLSNQFTEQNPPPSKDVLFRVKTAYTNQTTGEILYLANSLFYYDSGWRVKPESVYRFPSSGRKEISGLPLNVINSISEILSTTKFFMYRNNLYVIELEKPTKKIIVRSIYKYIIDCIDMVNSYGENNNGIVTVSTVDPDADTRTEIETNFKIIDKNNALRNALSKYISIVNPFDETTALIILKNIFNEANDYEKSSIHALDRVSNNILLDKYKTAFSNVVVNTMTNKESNIYSSSVITDKFDMYVYINSLYQNLITSLNLSPIENKGGACYDYKANKSYFGFINYDNDLVSFDYVKATNSNLVNNENISYNDSLTKEEQTALLHDIENQNYIRRLLNYKQYNLNAEEFNYRYDEELYRRNYKNITNSEKVLETYNLDHMKTQTYEEPLFGIADILDKSIKLYTEYLYSNNNKNNKDTEDVDSITSFNRRTLHLYTEKIHDSHNMFKLTNNDTYQLKHIFSNTEEDTMLFIESLQQKIDRGE